MSSARGFLLGLFLYDAHVRRLSLVAQPASERCDADKD